MVKGRIIVVVQEAHCDKADIAFLSKLLHRTHRVIYSSVLTEDGEWNCRAGRVLTLIDIQWQVFATRALWPGRLLGTWVQGDGARWLLLNEHFYEIDHALQMQLLQVLRRAAAWGGTTIVAGGFNVLSPGDARLHRGTGKLEFRPSTYSRALADIAPSWSRAAVDGSTWSRCGARGIVDAPLDNCCIMCPITIAQHTSFQGKHVGSVYDKNHGKMSDHIPTTLTINKKRQNQRVECPQVDCRPSKVSDSG